MLNNQPVPLLHILSDPPTGATISNEDLTHIESFNVDCEFSENYPSLSNVIWYGQTEATSYFPKLCSKISTLHPSVHNGRHL